MRKPQSPSSPVTSPARISLAFIEGGAAKAATDASYPTGVRLFLLILPRLNSEGRAYPFGGRRRLETLPSARARFKHRAKGGRGLQTLRLN